MNMLKLFLLLILSLPGKTFACSPHECVEQLKRDFRLYAGSPYHRDQIYKKQEALVDSLVALSPTELNQFFEQYKFKDFFEMMKIKRKIRTPYWRMIRILRSHLIEKFSLRNKESLIRFW